MKFTDLSEERQMECVAFVMDALMEIKEAGLPLPYKINYKITKEGRDWVSELERLGKEPSTKETKCTIDQMIDEGYLQSVWSLQ